MKFWLLLFFLLLSSISYTQTSQKTLIKLDLLAPVWSGYGISVEQIVHKRIGFNIGYQTRNVIAVCESFVLLEDEFCSAIHDLNSIGKQHSVYVTMLYYPLNRDKHLLGIGLGYLYQIIPSFSEELIEIVDIYNPDYISGSSEERSQVVFGMNYKWHFASRFSLGLESYAALGRTSFVFTGIGSMQLIYRI